MTWVRRGLPVIPCSRTDKRPLVGGFGRDATAEQLSRFSDPEQVSAWWLGRYRRAHVGLLTRSLVVIDLDMPKHGTPALTGRWEGCQGGSDVLELLAREAGADWPETYTVMTPSGGMHLYFEQPHGEPIGCATGDGPTPPHLGPLVDVRGVGGLVIAAGSYSSTQGVPYTRVSPPAVRPQPLPSWLLELLRPAKPPAPARGVRPVCVYPPGRASQAERYAAAALTGQVATVARAAEGERNRLLFAAARRLGELHSTAPDVLSESGVRELLVGAAVRAGLTEREALRTIRSGWERGTADAGLGGAA